MIEFACPECGHRIKIADEFAGRRGKCAGCGKQILVPATATVPGNGAQSPPASAFDDLMDDVIGPPLGPTASASATSSPAMGPTATPPPPLLRPGSNLQGCPDCSGLVSPRAVVCPHCGCPIQPSQSPAIAPPWTSLTLRHSTWSAISGVVGTLGMLYFAFHFDTTVSTEGGQRIHNQGLLNDRIVGVIVFGFIAVRAWIPDWINFDMKASKINERALLIAAAALIVIAILLSLTLVV